MATRRSTRLPLQRTHQAGSTSGPEPDLPLAQWSGKLLGNNRSSQRAKACPSQGGELREIAFLPG